MKKFEEIQCPLCERNRTEKLLEGEDMRLNTTPDKFRVVFCKDCRFIYINPRPKEEELSKFYPPDYHNPTLLILEMFYLPVIKMVFKRIIREIKKIKKSGRILDIGCGKGVFLRELLKYGYDIYGVDPYENILECVLPEVRSRVKNSSILNTKFPENFFDVIVMKQVLEHIYDINAVIREIRRILKKDGIAYVEVPNFNCKEAKLFEKFWYNLEIPRHLYQFTKETLKKFFLKYDFKVSKELGNFGIMIFKSPLAIVNSFYFFLKKKVKSNLIVNLTKIPSFFPLIFITLILRFFRGRKVWILG